MTLTLETGAGVHNANSYVTTTFIDNYLSNRNRATENSWDTATTAQKEAAAIAATQYIDARFAQRWIGSKKSSFDGRPAEGIIEFAGLPSNDETIIIGAKTYTFKTTLSTLTSDNEVLIGADAAATAANLVSALGQDGTDVYSDNIRASSEINAAVNADTDTQVDLVAIQDGESGNDITLDADSVTNVTATGMINGLDEGVQNLQWPRTGVYDTGVAVVGIPRNLKWAACEYAIRAHSAQLFQDPSVDASGRAVKKEKIGPIETEYTDGSSLDLLIRPYPAADYMLKPYLTTAGTYR